MRLEVKRRDAPAVLGPRVDGGVDLRRGARRRRCEIMPRRDRRPAQVSLQIHFSNRNWVREPVTAYGDDKDEYADED